MSIQPASLGVIFSIFASINYGKLGSIHYSLYDRIWAVFISKSQKLTFQS